MPRRSFSPPLLSYHSQSFLLLMLRIPSLHYRSPLKSAIGQTLSYYRYIVRCTYLYFMRLIQTSFHFLTVLVPSIAPTNVRVSKLQFSELKVQWDPIPEHSANGRLLGYRVYFQEYSYWYGYVVKTANTSNPYVNMVVLRGLKVGQRYRIWVLAFTSAGVGPQSSSYYVITGT